MADGRRLFAPTVLLGLAGSGLAALAGGKPWAAPDSQAGSTLVDHSGGHVPLAGALGLVALACWGVVLVTRARVRRAVAALGALVAAGLVATVVLGRASALDSAREATVVLGTTNTHNAVTNVNYGGPTVAASVNIQAQVNKRHQSKKKFFAGQKGEELHRARQPTQLLQSKDESDLGLQKSIHYTSQSYGRLASAGSGCAVGRGANNPTTTSAIEPRASIIPKGSGGEIA